MGLRPLPALVALVLVCLGCSAYEIVVRNETVCQSVDIRNTVDNFKKLKNCTVIEGYLQILLIDNGKTDDYKGLSFPDLVEITGFVLLYRAFGLNSLGRIFPNLAIIRGRTLFHNYALIVFEMYNLQEIGLSHLTDILRGSVRIEKNPGLCYVDTVDWDLLAKEGNGGHLIRTNKKNDECPNACPGPNLCPDSTREGNSVSLCWNSQNCQKVCAISCEKNATCSTPSGFCCHQECLAGCYGTTAYDCIACRHVLFEGKCLKKCPPGTFELINRRCVQELECKNYDGKVPKSDDQKEERTVYWKPFKGQCIYDCPPDYKSTPDQHGCIKCDGKCPKICEGVLVDHISAAQNLRDCTIVNGSLEIHIQGGSNVIRELEENLYLIEEINGYLKIARSYPLISLNFLKSLKVIHGDILDKKEYSLLVLDNNNLQELWDWKSREEPLQIKKGKIFFHFNPKLCPSKIEELKKYSELLDFDERDVSPNSNGDRVACDVTNMNVTTTSRSPSQVEVKWESFQKYLHDERSLLGYVVYYREAPSQNISIFDGRDACGFDSWTVRDVESSDVSKDHISYTIENLMPFTQYALYIRTYTTLSGRQGAQSSIVYFTTESDTPSPPVDFTASSAMHGEIVISWDSPHYPNGNVTHYIVEGIYDEDLSNLINQRDYCSEPISYPDPKNIYDAGRSYKNKPEIDYMNSSFDTNKNKECCACPKDHHAPSYDDEDAEHQIHFEDFLHNTVYLKNPDMNRRRRKRRAKRSIPSAAEIYSLNSLSTTPISEGDDHYKNDFLYQFKRSVYYRPFLVVSNLKHFSEYTVEIRACQDRKFDLESEPCSTKSITSVRTLPLDGADDINSSTLQVVTENITHSAFVKWEEPKDPNGAIVSYNIEYQRVDSEYKPVTRICLTRSNYFLNGGYYLAELKAGNYSLRVKANSLAKYGNWTSHIHFIVPSTSENSTMHIVLVVTLVLLFALLFCSLYGVYKWKFSPSIPDYVDYASVNPEYMSSHLVYEPDEWEIPREKIKLLDELGQGSFGMVYRGEVIDLNGKPFTPCAAKIVNEAATLRERIEFLQEASVMKAFNCNHVIKLLGVVSKGQPTLVIMELMTNGDLKSYLRSHRPDSEENPGQQPPTLKQILQMASEIADGMAYLAAKKFVHRDLAARNCMVAEDLTVKIGDFGMTRDVYETDYYRKGGKGLLPVRWMSPESLKDGIFDSQTDVWSFGIVLWEMATLASQPYQGLSNEDVLKYVISGKTMVKPEDCSENLYNLMVMCWHKNPKARVTFIEIIEMLLPDVSSKFHHVSYYFTQRHLINPVEPDDLETPTTPLRSSMREENNDDQSTYRYFPSVTQLPEETSNHDELSDVAQASCLNSRAADYVYSECSKGISVNYSDGSKVSNIPNGSVANGHISLNIGRATEC